VLCSGSAQRLGLSLRTLTGTVTTVAIRMVDRRHFYHVEIYSRTLNHVSSYYICFPLRKLCVLHFVLSLSCTDVTNIVNFSHRCHCRSPVCFVIMCYRRRLLPLLLYSTKRKWICMDMKHCVNDSGGKTEIFVEKPVSVRGHKTVYCLSLAAYSE